MPAPIAFNTGSQTAGTLKVAGLEYSISSSIGSGSANLRWFPTVNPGPYGLVFATSNFTQSYGTYQASTPLFYTASNTVAGIISASNRLPDRYNQTQFTTTASALEWIASSGKYFMMNYEYPQIVSNGLLMNIDSSFLASYPRSNTLTYDVTSLNGTGSLINGTGWNSDGYFTFDGVDDQINIPGKFPSSVSGYTVEYTAYLITQNRMPIASLANNNFYKFGDNSWYYTHGGVADEFYYPGGTITGWGHWAITYDGSKVSVYRQGIFLGSKASSGTANLSAGWILGYWLPQGAYAWDGYIASARIYSRALTYEEVLQNYFEGPIVTTNLIHAIDSSNIVSFAPSSSVINDLTGSVSYTLSNTTVNQRQGAPILTFSNTLGQISGTGTLPTSTFSLEYWVRLEANPDTGGNNNWRWMFNQNTFGGSFFNILEENATINFTVVKGGSFYRTIGGAFTQASLTIGEWTHLVYSYNSTTGDGACYKNGVLLASGNMVSGGGTLDAGSIFKFSNDNGNPSPDGTGAFPGSLSILRLYSTELTQAQVLQNFNAMKSRFGY